MGIEAPTYRHDGSEVSIPISTNDWKHWVSAGRTRNWMLDDPLIDWLLLYGKTCSYIPKQELAAYNKTLDFTEFIFEKGRQFEAYILRLLRNQHEVIAIAQDYRDIRLLDKARETFAVMCQGTPFIHQAVLWDAQHMTHGSPDFLVRSDVLLELMPGCISDQEASTPAPGLDAKGWHYLVVDTKFTTLRLNAGGTELSNEGSRPAYKAQLYIYNRMLGRLQGFEPPNSYLLGRGWQRTQKGETLRSSNALDLLAPIPQNGAVANKVLVSSAVEAALDWVRRVRTEGKDWKILPTPSVPELYPNMSNVDDADMMLDSGSAEMEPGIEGEEGSASQWVSAKKWLAGELKELTMLWQVGVTKRRLAHEHGKYRWDDPNLTPVQVGVTGQNQAPILGKLLEVNRKAGPPVQPELIVITREKLHPIPAVEFYVDFEYCNDLNDDFSKLPEKGGQPIIFMIGCGYLEEKQWRFKSFTTDRLTEDEELRIIQEWAQHMSSVRKLLDPGNETPRIFHWSKAEITVLESSHNSARIRHGKRAEWPEFNWCDLLTEVVRKEPVVVQGSLDFGLKAVANAMHAHGFIETNWEDSQIDGLGAMLGAWRCDEAADKQGGSMAEMVLMDEIVRYNETDCKVMMEIVRHLRTNH